MDEAFQGSGRAHFKLFWLVDWNEYGRFAFGLLQKRPSTLLSPLMTSDRRPLAVGMFALAMRKRIVLILWVRWNVQ